MDLAELVTWVRVQLDEDERVARAAKPGPWRYEPDPCEDEVYSVHDGEHGDLVGDIVCYVRGLKHQVANGVHIARFNPARTLDEIRIKREALGDCVRYASRTPEPPDASGETPWTSPVANFAYRTLCRLAAPYADRPGYRDEWSSAGFRV